MSTSTTAPRAPRAQVVPHEREAVLAGGAEQVHAPECSSTVMRPKSIATVVVVLAVRTALASSTPADAHGHGGLGRQRLDLGDGADEGGLADAEAAGDDELDRRDMAVGRCFREHGHVQSSSSVRTVRSRRIGLVDPDGANVEKRSPTRTVDYLAGQVHISGQFGNRYGPARQRQQRPLLCGLGQLGPVGGGFRRGFPNAGQAWS